jgi:NitT/TauT family transport system substrate-binding protein
MIQKLLLFLALTAVSMALSLRGSAHGQETFRISYGGYNETAAPMWVGIDRGVFKKYGIDAQMIQVRNGALCVAALVSREVEAVWPAQSTILSTVSGAL